MDGEGEEVPRVTMVAVFGSSDYSLLLLILTSAKLSSSRREMLWW